MTDRGDADLVLLLQRRNTDLFTWSSEYPEDQVDRNALASVERDLGWVTSRLPGSTRASQLATEPKGETLRGGIDLLVEVTWWLDTCSDEDVDEWVAGNLQESTAYLVNQMPDQQRSRLLSVLEELAATEQHDGRRYEIRSFPFAMGLVETEPEEPKRRPQGWVRPQDRNPGQAAEE